MKRKTFVASFDRICTHILAFEDDAQVRLFLGNWSDYETDYKENKMNQEDSLWQFIKDGLVGVVVTLILPVFSVIVFSILFPMGLAVILFGMRYIGFARAISLLVSLLLFVLLIAFTSMGIGGRFLENITSRWSWVKPILIISIVSMVMGSVLSLIVAGGWGLGATPVPAGMGFLIASLAGVIFNPSKRIFRLIIGAISSAVFGNMLVVSLFIATIFK